MLFVKKLKADLHITIHDICETYEISIGTAEIIAHDELSVRQFVARAECSKYLLKVKMFQPDGPKRLNATSHRQK